MAKIKKITNLHKFWKISYLIYCYGYKYYILGKIIGKTDKNYKLLILRIYSL